LFFSKCIAVNGRDKRGGGTCKNKCFSRCQVRGLREREKKQSRTTAKQNLFSSALLSSRLQNPDLTLLVRGVKVSMASNAEREAGASREEGADEGRAFVIASAAPAWPVEATMMSFWFSSILSFEVAAAAVSKPASGTIFTVIALLSGKRAGKFLSGRERRSGARREGERRISVCSFSEKCEAEKKTGLPKFK
jgi:hypothetical protein